jgi:hypothetical protein
MSRVDVGSVWMLAANRQAYWSRVDHSVLPGGWENYDTGYLSQVIAVSIVPVANISIYFA